METHPPKEKMKLSLLSKITYVLIGIFFTSLTFAISLELFNETGIWLGAIFNAIVVFIGFYYFDKKSTVRIVTWSVFVTLLLGGTAFIVGLQILKSALEGF